MALEGTIKEFGLADIFQLIALQKKTGVLFLNGSEGTVNIHFEDGMVVKTETSQKKSKHLIGRILLNRRKINEAQLKEALHIQVSTGQKVGSVLIGLGLINKDDLRDALAFQMSESIYHVFRWKGGDYKFYQDKVDYDRDTVVPLNSENILMDGVRMLDEWPRIDKKLPSIEVVLRKTEEANKLELSKVEGVDIFSGPEDGKHGEPGGLSKEAVSVLRLVDGKKSVYELIEYSSYGEFDTLKALVDLIDKGFVAKTGAKPDILTEAPPAVKETKSQPVQLGKISYAFVAAALILIYLQVTGTRRITSAGETGLITLKSAFAIESVETIYENALLYYYDFGDYPPSAKDLVQHDYISKAQSLDPWGGPLFIVVDKEGNLGVTSAGPDKTLNTGDDISNRP